MSGAKHPVRVVFLYRVCDLYETSLRRSATGRAA